MTEFSLLLQRGASNAWLFIPSAVLLGALHGLALTMVASGALAALSVKHVSGRWSGLGEFAGKAPHFSGALILLVGCYVGYQGLRALGNAAM